MTTISLAHGSFGVAVNQGVTNYSAIGAGRVWWNATENQEEHTIRSIGVGTLGNIWCVVTANSASAGGTLTLRKNGADTGVSVPITASTTGQFEDTTDTPVSYADGDEATLELTVAAGSGSMTVEATGLLYDVSGSTILLCHASPSYSSSANSVTAHFAPIGGIQTVSNTEAHYQMLCRSAGTWRYARARVTTNARSTDSTLNYRKNGASTAAFTIPGGSTGLFEDTSGSVACADGDLINWRIETGTGGGTLTVTTISSVISYDTPAVSVVASRSAESLVDARYCRFPGEHRLFATEANAYLKALTGYTLSNFWVYVSNNSMGAGETWNLRVRKNAANGNGSIAITEASGTGRFEDTTSSDVFAAGDTFDVSISQTGGAGVTQVTSMGGLMTYPSAAPPQLQMDPAMQVVGSLLRF